jgi:hypothetical protein
MSNLVNYLEQYGLLSLEKQEKLAHLLGEYSMELDFESGIIRFTDGLEFPFQVLGTESDNSLTWLWAWAGEQTEVPDDLMRSSLQMRAWGEQEGIPECTRPSVDLNKADGHFFSLIASEVCGASCYYQDAYEGGGLFLLLFGHAIDQQPDFTVAGLTRQFSSLLSLYDFNHRNAFRSYFSMKKLSFTEHASFIVTELESGEDVRANFDSAGKLISINGKNMPIDTI